MSSIKSIICPTSYRKKKTAGGTTYLLCFVKRSKVMGIRHSIMILLLALCASLSTNGQTEEVKERYKKFIRQHVFGAMNVQRCDSEIRTRRITGSQNDNSCKEVNTFILANNKQVKAVCTGGEDINGPISSERFFLKE
ncbi:hypothetical protein QQF64_007253 [Cirrhinus molitorella]|uniref:Ribonuclease A-domain domain-containing protein n=1 Tax=Cirrhinus molitorella TaxID=172907 RepID=A0ABR3MA35_9TELE